MTSRKITTLFMWPYQHYFRQSIEHLMNNVLETFGVTDFKAECLLVGTRIPEQQKQNDVCVEPVNGKWDIHLFNNLFNLIEMEINNHSWRNTLYKESFIDEEFSEWIDKKSMRDKPENIRRDSVRLAVQKAMKAYDSKHDIQSFAGKPAPVNDYYVTPILQLPSTLFERFRPLRESVINDGCFTGHASLIHAAVSEVLAKAHDELLRPDPGRFVTRSVSYNDIVQHAASLFMRTLAIIIRNNNFLNSFQYLDFEKLNMISSLMYEGVKGVGSLLLAKPEDSTVDFLIRFAKPVPFNEYRWSRKVLELASSGNPLIANRTEILGLGHIAADIDPWKNQNVFQIDFLDHYHWRLSCGDEVMLVSKYGVPSLPQEIFSRELLLDTYQRLFPKSCEKDIDYFTEILKTATRQQHGSMLIVAEDAASEAHRLQGEGTRIEPAELTPDLYRQVSSIDGAVIIDPHGLCHAIGVILDGRSEPKCTPSRGARYNSAIRYINSSNQSRLAVVVSDDQTIDFIPLLRRRIKRSALENAILELEAATPDNYHSSIVWLNFNKFYLNQKQCYRVNKALERIGQEPIKTDKVRISLSKFSPDFDFNESYYENEDN